jgi:chromosome segregation ATPase
LDDAEAEAVKRNQELTLELESEKRKVATKEARLIAVQMESHAKQKIVDDLQKQLKSKEGLLNTTTVESNSLKKNLAAKSDELVEVNGRLKKLNEDFVKVRESENKKGNELALLQNSLQTTIDNAVADATKEIRSVVDQQKSAFRALAEIAKKQAEDNKGVVDRLLKQIEEGEQQYAAIESS